MSGAVATLIGDTLEDFFGDEGSGKTYLFMALSVSSRNSPHACFTQFSSRTGFTHIKGTDKTLSGWTEPGKELGQNKELGDHEVNYEEIYAADLPAVNLRAVVYPLF
ncbi:hypothetical protein CEK25_012544 [Fusarium fujikuroi]|nr:hypothetical protein CEK25_012544 [Fusarium fujikuroi]